jgi:hypothetical protein
LSGVSDIVLETSAVATDTIDYVATLPAQAGDPSDLTATSTRTILIEPTTTPTTPPAVQAATSTSP